MPRQPKLRDTMPDGSTRADLIVFYVKQGVFLTVAAQAAGIHEATLYRWLQDERPMFREFREALERARAEAEAQAVLRVQAAARGGQKRMRQQVAGFVDGEPRVVELLEEAEPEWKAAAWLLERTWAPRYGRRQAIEVTGKDGGAIVVRDEEASRLAGGFERYLSERGIEPPAIDPPRPAEDVVDAEVVDDDEAGSPAGGDGGA